MSELILKYNQNIGGVNKNDQLRQYYSIRARGRNAMSTLPTLAKMKLS